MDNERYDDYNRWTGGINFGGKVGVAPCAGRHGAVAVQLAFGGAWCSEQAAGMVHRLGWEMQGLPL